MTVGTKTLLKAMRALLFGVALAALLLSGFTSGVSAQEARQGQPSTKQLDLPVHPTTELPAHPTKLKEKPLPPKPKGSAGGSGHDAKLIADEGPNGTLVVAGELIVSYKADASATVMEKARESVAAHLDQELPKRDSEVLSFPEVRNAPNKEARQKGLEQKKQALERHPDVESVSYNYVAEPSYVPNDPAYTAGYQWDISRIKAPAAWDRANGSGSRVAVLDTGFDTSHPDLRGQIVWQWDFFGGDSNAAPDYGWAGHEHGTHVAGTVAAATNNGTGVAGTAPRAQIFAAKVCGPMWSSKDGQYKVLCDSQAVVNALDYFARYASTSSIKAANLSLGGPGYWAEYERAVNNAWNSGIVVVAAAGNEAQKGNPVIYPAAFQRAIAVANTNSNDYWSSTSSYGSYVDVAAPGSNIWSTYPGGKYGYMSGTSMAAPHVAGLAALLGSQGLNKDWIRYRIEATATDLGTAGKDQFYGYGRINAQAAVTW